MFKTNKADKKRKMYRKKDFCQNSSIVKLLSITVSTPVLDTTDINLKGFERKLNSHTDLRKQALMINRFSFKFKPLYQNANQVTSDTTNMSSNSNKITTMLILISFSYAILNLPYLITW